MPTIKRAMIVGVNTYADTEIPDLEGANNDASEFKELLCENSEFEVAKEHFLLDEKATYNSMMSGVSDLLWNTDPCDLVLIYFSGHGFADNYGNGYVAPHDISKQRPLVHGIQMQLLKTLALRSLNKKKVVLMLDCCYSGITTKGEKTVSSAVEMPDECFSDIGAEFKATEDATGTIIFSSSASDQTSRERMDCRHMLGHKKPHTHGEFTFQLLEGLSGGAAADEHGWISASNLMNFVNQKMKAVPNQTTKFFGADIANLDDIMIARAAKLSEISEKLQYVCSEMKKTGHANLIFAAKALAEVLESSPNYKEALQLREELEERLKRCKIKTITWLLGNRSDLMQQARQPFLILEKSAHNLCFDEVTRSTRITNLLTALVQAADGEMGKDILLSYLLADESIAIPTGPRGPGKGQG